MPSILREVPLSDVRISDLFWSSGQKLMTDVNIP